MAARLDLYSLPDGHHPEWFGDGALVRAQDPVTSVEVPGAPVFLGFVSASDADEQSLFDVLGSVADLLPEVDPRVQGYGFVPAESMASAVAAIALVAKDHARATGAERGWIDTLVSCLERSASDDNSLGWQTRYDRSGTPDDGPDEFATAWSVVIH